MLAASYAFKKHGGQDHKPAAGASTTGAAGAAIPMAKMLLGLDAGNDGSAYDKAELVRGFLRRLGSFINGSQSGIEASVHLQNAQQQAIDYARIVRQSDARFRVAYTTPGSTIQYLGLAVAPDERLYDIMIDRRTGMARSVVIAGQAGYSAVDPDRIGFTNATLAVPAVVSFARNGNPPMVFTYGATGLVNEVSLRGLQNAPILDDQRKQAGAIDTIVYRNQTAQALIFTVPGTLPGSGTMFSLPYTAVRVGTDQNGNQFAQLNRDQTAAVAEAMARAE